MQSGPVWGWRSGVAGLGAGVPLGMLIALAAKIGHALPAEEGKVA